MTSSLDPGHRRRTAVSLSWGHAGSRVRAGPVPPNLAAAFTKRLLTGLGLMTLLLVMRLADYYPGHAHIQDDFRDPGRYSGRVVR